MRATNHNVRRNIHGTPYDPDHNDRNFDTEKARHIDGNKSSQNWYWTWNQGEGGASFKASEMAFYERFYGDYLQESNLRYIRGRKRNRVRDMQQYYNDNPPEETLFQIGKAGETISKEKLQMIFSDYVKWHNSTFQNVTILDIAMHNDEHDPDIEYDTPPQYHIRKAWWAHDDKTGMIIASERKALKEMGIKPPKNGKNTKYNNPKITYTAMCREKQIEICKKHGVEIEWQPKPKDESGQTLEVYKRKQEEKRLKELERKSENIERNIIERTRELEEIENKIEARRELRKAEADAMEHIIHDENTLPEKYNAPLPEREYETNILGRDKETEESKERRNQAIHERNKFRQEYTQSLQRENTVLKESNNVKTTELRQLEIENHQLKQQLTETRADLAGARAMIDDYTGEPRRRGYVNLDPLKALDLEQVLQEYGYERDPKCSTRNNPIYRSSDGRKIGLYRDRKSFKDNFDPDFNGRYAIDLVLCIKYGSPHQDRERFMEAVDDLIQRFGMQNAVNEIRLNPSMQRGPSDKEIKKVIEEIKRTPKVMPQHCKYKVQQAMDFLRGRNISRATVEYLLKSTKTINTKDGDKEIQQMLIDQLGNICIPRPGNGIEDAWIARGTYGGQANHHVRTYGQYDCGTAMLRGPNATDESPIYVCEGPTDGIALMQIHPDCNIAIVPGNMHTAVVRKSAKQKVILAFDNDEVGTMHTEHYRSIIQDAEIEYPPAGYKDWSDVVRAYPAYPDGYIQDQQRLKEQQDKERREEAERRRTEEIHKAIESQETTIEVDTASTPRPS